MAAGTLMLIGVIVAALAAMALLGRRVPSSFASRFHCLGPPELQDPSPNCPVGDVETTLGEQVLDSPLDQREKAIGLTARRIMSREQR
jgi:hypothetical protein